MGLGRKSGAGTTTYGSGSGPRQTPGQKKTAAQSATTGRTSNRSKYVREDTGTHETLKILDESLVGSTDDDGFDPYNTGGFDRSRNWDRRFRD